MLRRIILASFVAALLTGFSAAQSTVTVGTWNLEWLGTPDKRNKAARSDSEIEAIAARFADALDIEIAVLTEINTRSHQWRELKRRLQLRGYDFIEGSGGDQRVVIAFHKDEVERLSSFEAQVDTEFDRRGCRTRGARKPLVGTFKSGHFDFTVVGVHWKSDRKPSGCRDDDFTGWVRSRQAAQVLDVVLSGQASGVIDRDVAIVGDFNAEFGDRSLKALRESGYSILTEARHRSGQSGRLSFRKGSFQSALDHLAVPSNSLREWVKSSTMYWPDLSTMNSDELAEYHRAFSDHAPAWAEFRTDLQDDDAGGPPTSAATLFSVQLRPLCRCQCGQSTAWIDGGTGICSKLSGLSCEIVSGTAVEESTLSGCTTILTNR